MKFTKLLENYIILKEKDRELYYDIIDNVDKYREFINDNLSYNLIVKEDFIKLEKIPAMPKSWMGIKSFNNKKEYIFFLLVLMYLEDKNKEEQFILSNITEYIEHNYPDEKIEWTVFKNRRSLITVLKFSLELGIIKKNDGEEEDFNKSENGEILYESTGISRYIVRRFNREIFDSESYEELLEDAIEGISTDKGIIRKNRVFRELTLSPIVYNGENSSDYEYIKNYRNSIKSIFEKYLEWDIHIHKNGAMAVIKNANEIKDTFPSGKGESAITLFVNRKIKNMLEDGKLIINDKDTIIIKEELFDEILLEVKNEYGQGFTKAFRDALDSYYLETIKRFMEEYYLINVEDGHVELMPLIVKVTGKYPDDYNGEEK